MGVYTRPDSPFFWLALERPRRKPIRESTGIPVDGGTAEQTRHNRRLAQEAYSARMGDLALQRFELPGTKPEIADYREWYLERITSQKRAHLREASILRQLGAFFDVFALDRITIDDAHEWRTARRGEVSAATVNRERAVVKHLMGTAVPKYLDGNPVSGLQPLRVAEQDVRTLSRDEEARFLEQATVEERAVIICALDTLQRLSSVAGLQRAQDHRTYIRFLDPKAGTNRKVPVSKRLRKALSALPKNRDAYFTSWAHLSTEGRRTAVIRVFEDLCRRAEVPLGRRDGGVSFHCLRHTGASRMLQAGVDIETVRRIGGWANYRQLQRYLHPADKAPPHHTRSPHHGAPGLSDHLL
ncbi:MAG: site-specific integrase [Vicinamibacterales bacterium]|nr:site-specific integrase [Vicinamibacterales bacterium]MDP7692759.1 site-specific integrase [Vicinamibacterales bacterium]HJN44323.1 site-specific integrase [Vicinamibacterales bacterium]